MITEKTYIERVLIVFNEDGSVKGAHQEKINIVSKDGNLLYATMLPAEPVSETILESVLPEKAVLINSNIDLQSQVTSLNDEVTRLNSLLSQYQSLDTSGVISVDAASFRIALSRLGIRDGIEAALEQSNDQELKDLYAYRSVFKSNNAPLIQFAESLGMTELLNQVFTVAKQVMEEA